MHVDVADLLQHQPKIGDNVETLKVNVTYSETKAPTLDEHAVAAFLDNKVVYITDNKTMLLDLSSENLSCETLQQEGHKLPRRRVFMTLIGHKNRLVLFGGSDARGWTNATYIIDVSFDTKKVQVKKCKHFWRK